MLGEEQLSHIPLSDTIGHLFPFIFSCAADIFVFIAVRLSQCFLFFFRYWGLNWRSPARDCHSVFFRDNGSGTSYIFSCLCIQPQGWTHDEYVSSLERLQEPPLLGHDNWQPVKYSNEGEDKCLEYSQCQLSFLTSFTYINDI